jgi:peptide/nickel transport system substrate-binding protein
LFENLRTVRRQLEGNWYMESSYWTRRQISRRSVLRGTGALGVGAVGAVLIGCGSDDDGDAPAAATSAPAAAITAVTQAVATTAPDKVKRGGTLRWEIAGDPPNFDMHSNSTYRVNNPLSAVHNMLVQMDPFVSAEPPDAVIPDLAKSWTLDDDLTVTFDLHDNAKFHDGKPFTSADVKATFERIWNPSDGMVSPREKNGDAVASIETPDDYTVVMKLNQPSPSLLPMIATGWNAIYSHVDIGNDRDFKLEINGTGPYLLDDYTRGNRFELSKNPDYFVDDRPYLDGMIIYVIPDSSTRVASFQSGELDLFRGPSVTDSKTMVDALGDKIVLDGPMPSNGFGSINFNSSKEPWNDNRVREAIAMAMNRDAAIALLNQGEGFLGGYFNPSGGWASSLSDVQKVPGYTPYSDKTVAEARKLLDAAGVPEGFEATILTRQGSTYEDLSLYILDGASKIGIVMTPDVQETASAYDRLNTRNFDLAPWSHGYALDDPDALFGEFYVDGASRNYSEISTPEIEALYAKQTIELDVEARADLARQLEIAALGQYGKIVTSWSATRELRWAYVKNRVKHGSSYNNKRMQDVWLDV